jgi:uncharacterized membrane protein YvlD (DUF360 family)
MTKLLVRWVIAALAIFVAALIVPGIRVSGTAWVAYAVMAVILGLVNALVRPVLKILTCPLILLTLGLFTLVINGFTFWLSARIANLAGHRLLRGRILARLLGGADCQHRLGDSLGAGEGGLGRWRPSSRRCSSSSCGSSASRSARLPPF